MAGFMADQVRNIDPSAMAGFMADQVRNIDPSAMAGFTGDQVSNIDPSAMAGFIPAQVMEMDSKAAEGFGAEQVRNLQPESKAAVGDKIETFENVPIEVRQELVAQPQRRLGGVGSFQDLAKSLTTSGLPQEGDGAATSPGSQAEGWDVAQGEKPSFGEVQTNDGSGENPASSEMIPSFAKYLALF